ncbi:MAG: FecR domain-containing protein [Chthoniobacterales bacterium]|nr:FecR domain-containing protein [Chthoniobacterales bacterium]
MRTSLPLVATIIFALSAAPSGAQQEMVPGQIRAVKVDGTVWKVVQSSGQRARIKVGDFILQGNLVETAGDGSVLFLFDNGSTMNLRPNTKFSVSEFLREPFDVQKVDYRKIKNEPSQSVTKVDVKDGAVYFDIPKLNKSSVCNLNNPVGTAGIRGTAGFIAKDSMGVTEGSVQFTTQTGQTQSLGTGQKTGFTPDGNFGPPPADAGDNMKGAENNSQNARQNVPSDAFAGAQRVQLTTEQQKAIEDAAKQGEDALLEAVKKIAFEEPEAASAAEAAAVSLMPEAARQIAAAAEQGARDGNQANDQDGGGSGGGSSGGAPPLPGGFGGGGGGGGGSSSGGGGQYSN